MCIRDRHGCVAPDTPHPSLYPLPSARTVCSISSVYNIGRIRNDNRSKRLLREIVSARFVHIRILFDDVMIKHQECLGNSVLTKWLTEQRLLSTAYLSVVAKQNKRRNIKG